MYSINRIAFISSLSIIVAIISLWILIALTPIEYSSHQIKESINQITGITLPLAIVLTLTGTLRDRENFFRGLAKVVLTLFVAFASLIIIVIANFDFCGMPIETPIYYSNRSPRKMIVVRKSGCSEFDSTYHSANTVLVRPFLPGMNWTTEIDTMHIDLTQWTKSKQETIKSE